MGTRGFNQAAMSLLLTLTLAGCGGGGGGGTPSASAGATPTAQADNPLEHPLADADLTVSGVSATGLNDQTVSLHMGLPSGAFGTSPSDVVLTADGDLVPSDAIEVIGNQVQATVNFSNALSTGLSNLLFSGSDSLGRLIHVHKQLRTGANTVTVLVQDAAGKPVPNADVTVSLADAPDVRVSQTTSNGTAVFQHLPSRTVLVEARAAGKLLGVAGDVANNLKNNVKGQIVVTLQPIAASAGSKPTAGFTVSTSGTTAQRISRSFTTSAGTQAVTVHYRFATAEWVAGHFGSPYSDYYSVQLRSAQGTAVDTNTMNGLGQAAFNGAGSTGLRTLRLLTTPGETVQLDAVVANVNDGAFDSQLIIDRIDEENSLLQTQLQWDASQGGVSLAVSLQGQSLAADQAVTLYWATGPSIADVQGAAIATFTLPNGTSAGTPSTFHVGGGALLNAPAGATHLIAAAGESAVSALPDVTLSTGPSADDSLLGGKVTTLLKEAARTAGTGQIAVAQTALTPAQQAHAMFLNLTRSTASMTDNTSAQQAVYGAEGDAVIQVFAAQAKDLSLAQVLAKQAAVEALMVAEINARGPGKVSAHCADPATALVLDVRTASVPAATASLFKAFVTARATKFADEATGLWHLELTP
jgi:hypothetical protein